MRQVIEFAEITQTTAKAYVARYLQDPSIREGHLRFMQVLENTKASEVRELAECIDVILWERDQEVFANSLELQENPTDHEFWSAHN